MKAKQQTFSFKLSKPTMDEMIKYFEYKKRDKTPPYALFQADEEDTVITLYESGMAVFQGISADIDANMWKQREKALTGSYPIEKSKKEKTKPVDNKDYYFISSIGSDEVGTGDYFGPIVVTASFVDKKDISFLEGLGVRDSKKIDDTKIMKIAPVLISNIPHKTIILSNKDYNKMYKNGMNMNSIKAFLHNKVLHTLVNEKSYKYDMIVIDEFVNEKKYYEYLSNYSNVLKGVTFTQKAEDKCLSVGVSSIISRYVFLNEMSRLSKEVNTTLLLGASSEVDNVAKSIIEKYGIDKLSEIAKMNFKNTDKVLEKDLD